MTSGAEGDVPWWKAAKAKSLQRKAAIANTGAAQIGDSFLIVTEGTVTEPTYFALLTHDLQLSTVKVKVIPGNHSHPPHVIQTAADEVKNLAKRAKKNQVGIDGVKKYDHVWAVIDTDVATREGIWNDVEQKARDLKVQLAHSTPCFEYWLLLHLKMTMRGDLIDGDSAKAAFRQELDADYSTNEKIAGSALEMILEKWPIAAQNAAQVRHHHQTGGTPIPANPSTEVDLLVTALNDSAQAHNRAKPNP